MNLLSIDPAVSKKIAYALFLDDRLKCYDLVPEVGDIEDIISAVIDLNLVVTEDMYLGKNFDTVKKLCYAVGEIIHVCKLYSIEYRLIAPVEWKSHHGLLKKPAGLEEKLQFEIIRQYTGEEITDVDIRAAVLIGMCHIEQARMGAV